MFEEVVRWTGGVTRNISETNWKDRSRQELSFVGRESQNKCGLHVELWPLECPDVFLSLELSNKKTKENDT